MFVYGPVPSRRLGKSLGVSPIPSKICSYNCIYCQLQKTKKLQIKKESFFPREKIINDLKEFFEKNKADIDYITFVGDGEPTLCNDIGWLIDWCKQHYQIPVAIITNGSILFNKEVRRDLDQSNVIIPSLDAGSEDVFKLINRPHRSINFKDMLQGLVDLRQEYSGKIWLEVMLVDNVNDSNSSLTDIKKAINLIQPDRVYISVPIRPPAEPWVKVPVPEKIIHAHEILGTFRELTDYESGEFGLNSSNDAKSAILNICSRHPLREEQAKEIESRFFETGCIDTLIKKSLLNRVQYRDVTYLLKVR
ncbi:Wyosine [tRNA(Phe)-imidazoG37] synthetase, radical SAM superfamily [Candidatus Methanomarinus sp.]|nr:Wyosine [tRNA(Phe)-imidazoG37] synthetase, radical SAM superfamily [ANME-2 cluster archaeon]